MAGAIEVEVRGRLTKAGYASLKRTLARRGRVLSRRTREMYLLRGYPGYSIDFVNRKVDARLRDTDGECELMVKTRAAHKNAGREEISLRFKDTDLLTARRAFRQLGFARALQMKRTMDAYSYQGIHWQVVSTPKGYWYWEAELMANKKSDVSGVQKRLLVVAEKLGLRVMRPRETQRFIVLLDKHVNKEVRL